MGSGLFRDQALEYQAASSSQFGKPTGVLPPSWSQVTWLLMFFMAGLLVFLLSVDFARKETVRGKLRLDGAQAPIYALESGIISDVYVVDGQDIEAGQPIVRISSQHFLGDGTELSEELLKSLLEEEQGLKARREAISEGARLARESAMQRGGDASRRESDGRAELEAMQQQLGIARERAVNAEGLLDEGLLAEPVYNERREAVAQLELRILQLRSRISEEQAAQERSKLEARQAKANADRELADVEQRLSQISGQITQANGRSGHVIHAPVAGRLTALAARVGEPVRPDQPLAVLLSGDSSLLAELYLPSSAIGFVEAGQRVKVQYDAFPYQKFGVAEGVILAVSSTGQMPNELGVPAERPLLLYRVEVALAEQSVKAFSKEFPLQPGMELSAVIVLENRRLIEWLLEPLRSRV